MKSKNIATYAVAAATLFALLATPAGAQSTSSSANGSQETQNVPSNANKVDQDFVTQAMKANDQEIDEARAELNSTTDPNVKMFAQRMINDHSAANAQIAALAKNFKMSYPASHIVNDQGSGQNQMNAPVQAGSPAPAAGQPNTAAAMPARDYMQKEVQDHQQTIALFQNEAKNGGSPQFRTLAGNMLPELQAHLTMAQQYTNTGRISPVGTPTPAANPPR